MVEDARTGRKIRHGLMRLDGYEDVIDRERLFREPAVRAIIDKKPFRKTP